MKELIKRILGQRLMGFLRFARQYLKYLKISLKGVKNKIVVSDSLTLLDEITIPEKNVFFGYYDIQQFNEERNKLLIHIVPKKASTDKDAAVIAYYDVAERKVVQVAESKAWSWQQGCRLRWNPCNQEEIFFNNCVDNKYVCQIWNINDKKLVKQIPIPLYDFDKKLTFGLGVNFSRLQRLRPGYGYTTLPDKTADELTPKGDGIFKYDFKTGDVSLLISYEDLAKGVEKCAKLQSYINHISISPQGDKFMFFHIMTEGPGMRWHVRFCVANSDGTSLKVLEETDTISHYTWKNNDVILTTKLQKGTASVYAEYNVNTGEKKIIESKDLNLDGHPTFFIDKQNFITDTYPQGDSMQHVFIFDEKSSKKTKLVDIYHDPRLYEEQRCDLHPRLTPDNGYFTIDTVYSDCKRSVLLFKLQDFRK